MVIPETKVEPKPFDDAPGHVEVTEVNEDDQLWEQFHSLDIPCITPALPAEAAQHPDWTAPPLSDPALASYRSHVCTCAISAAQKLASAMKYHNNPGRLDEHKLEISVYLCMYLLAKPQHDREDCQRRYMQRCATKVDDCRAKADIAKQAHEYAEAQLQHAEADLAHASSMYDQVKAMAPPSPPTVRMNDDDVTMRGAPPGPAGAAPTTPPAGMFDARAPEGSAASPTTPVAPSPNRAGEPSVPSPSVIADIQREQAKCLADQAVLSQQMQTLIAQFGPVVAHIQAQTAAAATVPVEPPTQPKKPAFVPPPAGQPTLAQTIGATRRSASAVPTHRGPGSVRRSPSRTRSGTVDRRKEKDERSRSPCDDGKEPSRPSGATLNLAEEREAARQANFHGGPPTETEVPPSPVSRSPK